MLAFRTATGTTTTGTSISTTGWPTPLE